MWPFFFFNSNSCYCADKIIDYLENEKYKWIPIKFTKKQYGEVKKMYKEGMNEIDNNPFFDYGRKIIARENLHRNIFYKKVLKKEYES